jgi:hypothetical protein
MQPHVIKRVEAITTGVPEETRNESCDLLLRSINKFLDSKGTVASYEKLDEFFTRDNPYHYLQYVNAGTEGLFNMMLACTGVYARSRFLKLEINQEVLDRLSDPLYLPSKDELIDIFQLNLNEKTLKASYFSSDFKSDDWDDSFTVETFLDHVLVCSLLRDGGHKRYNLPTALSHFVFCRRGNKEIYTKEYIDRLAIELSQLQKTSNNPNKAILEIGAGNGVLAYHLNKTGLFAPSYIHATDPKCCITENHDISEDFYSQFTPSIMEQLLAQEPDVITIGQPTPCPVEKLNWEEGIKRYDPDLVLCTWVPKDEDWLGDPTEKTMKFVHIGDTGRSGQFNKYKNLESIRLELSDLQVSSCDYEKVAGWNSTILIEKEEGF